jgi:hypothetical protein
MIDAKEQALRMLSRSAPKTVALVMAILAAASLPAKANCPYGDSSKPERAEIHQVNDGVYMCVDGEWIRNNDILAVIAIEKANVWTACCGSTDETAYVRAACDDQQKCSIPPAYAWAGPDPDPTRRKHLWVSYHCALGPKDLPTSHVATQVEETAPLNLSCRNFMHR